MSTINFNASYGDLAITKANDIATVPSLDEEVTQCLHTLLKTEYKDYRLSPNYGVDFQKWLGLTINKQLAETIKLELESKMKAIPQVASRSPAVMYILEKQSIIFRITVKGIDTPIDFSFTRDKGVRVL